MSEDSLKNHKIIEEVLNVISSYTKKQNWHIIVPIIIILLLIGISGVLYNCCKKQNINKDLREKLVIVQKEIVETQEEIKQLRESFQDSNLEIIRPTKLDQCIDSVKADFSLKTKAGDSLLNLSIHGQQNLNIRNDCFWFVIVSVIALLLIVMFYLISISSKESKLLQFVTDWNEQEKEIKLRNIEKEIELQKLKNRKEGVTNKNKEKPND